jgi:hypothetical protein
MPELKNRRVRLASRPCGDPEAANFFMDEQPAPAPGPQQILLRTLWLSLDPYMRGRMSTAASYAAGMELGDVMVGATISEVVGSQAPGFSPGDLVLSRNGWQDYALSGAAGLRKLEGDAPLTSALGLLGMPSKAAYFGMLDIGKPQPGDTVLVSAAAGAVGSVASQIAKIRDCRVVGVAGGAEKCAYLLNELGLDGAVDHRDENFDAALARACPNGIDVYFDNVGGTVLRAVTPLLNNFARICVCGTIGDRDEPAFPDRLPAFMRTVLVKRLTVRGFLVGDFSDDHAFTRDMLAWLGDGQLKYKEHVVEGLEAAPRAFEGLFRGENFGKLLVRVAHPQSRTASERA